MKIIRIQLKDICYYGDDFEYQAFYVIKDEDFEKKYKKLVKVCKNYEQFDEVECFIEENFTKIEIEERIIKI